MTSICALGKQIAKYLLQLVGQVLDFLLCNVAGVGAWLFHQILGQVVYGVFAIEFRNSLGFFPIVSPIEHPSYLNERTAQVLFSIAEERKIFFLRERHLSTLGQHSALDLRIVSSHLVKCSLLNKVFGLAVQTVAISPYGYCLTVIFKNLLAWHKCFIAPLFYGQADKSP